MPTTLLLHFNATASAVDDAVLSTFMLTLVEFPFCVTVLSGCVDFVLKIIPIAAMQLAAPITADSRHAAITTAVL